MLNSYCHIDDTILLIEDAVYCANSKHKYHYLLKERMVFCLIEDLDARGLSSEFMDCVHIVDYRGFVNLTVNYPPIMTWN